MEATPSFSWRRGGIDTFEASRRLAKLLKAPISYVSYASLKDASAVALQRFSIKGIDPFQASSLASPSLKVLKAQSFHKPLAKGELYGNRFTVTVRNIPFSFGQALSPPLKDGPSFLGLDTTLRTRCIA